MMPDITFYYAPGACSLAPHILLQESNLPFTGVSNTINAKESTFVSGFATLNPKMRVPVLILDGEVITEVPAIMTAIAGLRPEMHLLGRTEMESIRVYEWMAYLSSALHAHGFGALFRPQRFSDDPSAVNGIRSKARGWIETCFDIIENKLDGGPFAVGNALTSVDPYLFVFWRWGVDIGFEMEARWPKYTNVVKNLVGLEAVQKTLELEKIQSRL